MRGDQGAFTVGREERNCGVCGHTQQKEEWQWQVKEHRRLQSLVRIGLEPTWLLVAVFPRKGKTGGLQRTWAA